MKYLLSLGKIDYLDHGRADCAVDIKVELQVLEYKKRTVDLEEIGTYTELSICGNIWNHLHTGIYSSGLNLDTIARCFPSNDLVQQLVRIWDKWHLNGMKAGTRTQNAFIDGYLLGSNKRYNYNMVCDVLKTAGLLVDRDYRYGTAWLIEVLPEEVIEKITEICKQLS